MSTTDPTVILLLHGYREQELAARAQELRHLAELPARARPRGRARRRARASLRGLLTRSPQESAPVAR